MDVHHIRIILIYINQPRGYIFGCTATFTGGLITYKINVINAACCCIVEQDLRNTYIHTWIYATKHININISININRNININITCVYIIYTYIYIVEGAGPCPPLGAWQSLQLFRSRVPLLAPDFPSGGLFFTWMIRIYQEDQERSMGRMMRINILDHFASYHEPIN